MKNAYLAIGTAVSLALVLGCLSVPVTAPGQSVYPPGKIRGAVLDERGEPVAGARVDARVFGKSVPGVVPMAPTGKDGRFVIEHLALEEYSVSARKEEDDTPIPTGRSTARGCPFTG